MDFIKSIYVGKSNKIMQFPSCEIIIYSSEIYSL